MRAKVHRTRKKTSSTGNTGPKSRLFGSSQGGVRLGHFAPAHCVWVRGEMFSATGCKKADESRPQVSRSEPKASEDQKVSSEAKPSEGRNPSTSD